MWLGARQNPLSRAPTVRHLEDPDRVFHPSCPLADSATPCIQDSDDLTTRRIETRCLGLVVEPIKKYIASFIDEVNHSKRDVSGHTVDLVHSMSKIVN